MSYFCWMSFWKFEICAIVVISIYTMMKTMVRNCIIQVNSPGILIILLLICLSYIASAQTLDLSLFKSQSEERRAIVKHAREQKKEYRELINHRRREFKNLQNKDLDSLEIQDLHPDSVKIYQKLQRKIYTHTGEYHPIQEISTWDDSERRMRREAMSIAQRKLTSFNEFKKFSSYRDKHRAYRTQFKTYADSINNLDDLSDLEKDYLIRERKKQIQDHLKSELEHRAGNGLNEANLSELTHPIDQAPMNPKELGNSLSNYDKGSIVNSGKAAAVDHFQDNQKALSTAMQKTKTLKKKYSKVPNANDLSTATKRNSLKDLPFNKRLIFGGTFQIHIDRYSAIDLNPELSYRIHKHFNAGLGGTYQINTATEQFFDNLSKQHIMGYRAFVEHKLFKSFYGHFEFEQLNQQHDPNGSMQPGWYTSILAGLERRVKVRRGLEGQISLLYNFLHKSNPLYDSPWTLRFGFNAVPKKRK